MLIGGYPGIRESPPGYTRIPHGDADATSSGNPMASRLAANFTEGEVIFIPSSPVASLAEIWLMASSGLPIIILLRTIAQRSMRLNVRIRAAKQSFLAYRRSFTMGT
jgi:hypothetical protein